MNRKRLIVAAFSLAVTGAMAQSVKVYDTGRKWSGQFDALLENKTLERTGTLALASADNTSLISTHISVTDTAAVADYLRQAGYEAECITGELLVAAIPSSFVPTLAEREDVLYINYPTQLYTFMNNVRTETGVEKVTSGEELDTPFDGTGVIIGVIDQGFEYKHPAFTGRVERYGASYTSGTLRSSAPNSDANDDVGHATHVTNIAAGNQVDGSDYHGIATGADLVLISSDLSNSSVLAQTKAIKNYANGEGKPWVLNMSFGGDIGPRDGSTAFDQSMNDLVEAGGILVAAMGNNANYNCHAERDFTSDGETIYLYMKPDATNNTSGIIYSQVWGKEADGVKHLEIAPVVYYNGEIYEVTLSQLRSAGFYYEDGINSYNNKQVFSIQGYLPYLVRTLGITATSGYYLFWQVKGNAGDGFHAWVSANNGPTTFEAITRGTIKATAGDADYGVGEGGASVPQAVGVGAYWSAIRSTSLNGYTYRWGDSSARVGGLCYFSSHGPYLGDGVKPAIAAPGGGIVSAFSKNATNFDEDSGSLVSRITSDGSYYYYGVMSGTSMACPVVTGIVALWLQAYPELTYDQIMQIFAETGRHDTYTGTDADWTNTWGYGKIDAYEGLKKALELAQASGINETRNTEAPITLNKTNDAWKVLFNNDETYADITLYSLKGETVKRIRVESPHRGQECEVSLNGLTPGVYLFKASTTASNLTRKVVVK